jgi:MYXO-CTERM domain-containing protein
METLQYARADTKLGPTVMRLKRVCHSLAVAIAAALLHAPHAAAYSAGVVVPGCGCHNGGQIPAVKIITPNNLPALNETITLTVVIQAINGDSGGIYFEQSDGAGVLMAGPGTRTERPMQIVHSAPGRAMNGEVHFDVNWTAPDMPGVAYFKVNAVSANGSGAPTGDNYGNAALGVAVGCTAENTKTYYFDSDGDGAGTEALGVRPGCSDIPGWALMSGDCDENSKERGPGIAEVCNAKDDDCDGMVDEGVAGAVVYPDADGDGYGDPSGTPGTDCTKKGFVANNRDCNDDDLGKHPDALEVCNYFDDDCDGVVDEHVRPRCGVGACVSSSATCNQADCTPDAPNDEYCDLIDNDCDMKVDEGFECATPGSTAQGGSGAGAATGTANGAITASSNAGGASPPDRSSSKPNEGGGCSVGTQRSSAGEMLAWLAIVGTIVSRRRRAAGWLSRS